MNKNLTRLFFFVGTTCQRVHQFSYQEKLTPQHQESRLEIQNVDHVPSENRQIINETSSTHV